jgi:hypothetical protein
MTSPIALAWHVTKKDLRALHPLIPMWVVLTLVQTLLRTVWPPLTMALDPDLTQWVEPLRSALPIMRALTFVLIVASLVHADPLVGTEAFWLTRPISRPVLFVSKLLTTLIVLALPALLAQIAPMIAFGVPPLDLMRLLSENLLYFAAGLMAVFAAAALTPNLRSLAAWSVALFILWAGAAILTSGPPRERRSADGRTTMGDLKSTGRPGPGRPVTSLVLIATGCGVASWYQYRTRRRDRSALIAAATAGAVLVMPYLVPASALEARQPSFTDAPAVALGAGIRFQDGPRSVVMWPLGDRDGQCGVMVRVTRVQGIRTRATPPKPGYHFVHRPTHGVLGYTYFALPDRSRELAPGQVPPSPEDLELFQVLYRYAVLGPSLLPSKAGEDEQLLPSVDCRDVDVVVRPQE